MRVGVANNFMARVRVNLRQAELSDRDEICAVHTSSILGLCSSMYSQEEVKQWAARQTPHQYTPFIENGEITLALSPQGEVAGFGHLKSVCKCGENDVCEIKGLFVSPKWTRKGVGSVLLRHMEHQASSGGYTKMSLKSSLNAEEFYRRMGYSVVDAADKHVCCEQTLQCILMNKTLQ